MLQQNSHYYLEGTYVIFYIIQSVVQVGGMFQRRDLVVRELCLADGVVVAVLAALACTVALDDLVPSDVVSQ